MNAYLIFVIVAIVNCVWSYRLHKALQSTKCKSNDALRNVCESYMIVSVLISLVCIAGPVLLAYFKGDL